MRHIFILLFLCVVTILHAQNTMFVHLKDGNISKFQVEDVDSITFSTTNEDDYESNQVNIVLQNIQTMPLLYSSVSTPGVFSHVVRNGNTIKVYSNNNNEQRDLTSVEQRILWNVNGFIIGKGTLDNSLLAYCNFCPNCGNEFIYPSSILTCQKCGTTYDLNNNGNVINSFIETPTRLFRYRGSYTDGTLIVNGTKSDRKELNYSQMLEIERKAINQYIENYNITVITEAQYVSNNYITDTDKNEFMIIPEKGIYIQIVKPGSGEKLKDGETCTVLCRFYEKNLISGAELTNTISSFSAMPEKMSVALHGEQISGSFDPSSSLIYSTYGSTSVPQGWLEVLRYTNLGRIVSENDEPARVKIIVPHLSGQSDAQMNVYPCLYELNFEKGR